jgi:hypothetical protein
MKTEEWRPVLGYEGFYEVSSHGQVRSLDRIVPHSKFGKWRRKGALMKQVPNTRGYLAVQLCREGRVKRIRVNVLVAEAFLGCKPEWADQVNHKNKIKTDNNVGNLEWSNSLHNVRHANSCYLWNGKMSCLSELAEQVSIPRSALSKRINELGWTLDRALTTPVRLFKKQ